MRRDFELGPEDTRALETLGYRWETVKSGGGLWLILHDFPVPAGYTVSIAKVAIRLDAYPSGGIDMAYFAPPLARADGKAINNLSLLSLDRETFQQWSRHYAWTASRDTLSTHIRRVRGWLKHEFRKR